MRDAHAIFWQACAHCIRPLLSSRRFSVRILGDEVIIYAINLEEIARHHGFDKFPPRLPPAKQPARPLPHAEALERVIERLVALGYQEIVAIPIVDSKRDALFRPEGVAPAVIGNPLAEDASTMRSNGTVGMVDALEWIK